MTQVLPGTINTPLFDKSLSKLGVKPVGIPPIYEPRTVTNVLLCAAEHPARDLVARGTAKAMILNQRLAPGLVDAVLATRAGFSPQMTDEPKPESAPNNLFGSIGGHDTAKNGFRAFQRSFYNWLETRPAARRCGLAALGAAARLAALD